MEIVDRLLVMLITLLVGISSIFMVGISFGFFERGIIESFFSSFQGNIQFGILGGVLFLISIRILQLFFRKKKVKEAMVVGNEIGNVMITLDALNSLVMDIVEEDGQFDNIDSKLRIKDDGVWIKMSLSSDTKSNIPQRATELQDMIGERVSSLTGVEISKVEVLVKEIKKEKSLRVD